MDNNSTKNSSKLHPMLWVAAIAVTVLAIAGVAAMTGVFPASNSEEVDPYAKQPVAAAKPAPKPATPTPVAKAEPEKKICHYCGVVTSVNAVKVDGEGTGLGAVAGGVLGGVLGHQVGGGNGKKIATVAGVAGGAYAGNEIEKNQRATTVYDINIRMEDGSTRHFRKSSSQGLHSGDRVRLDNGNIIRI